MRQLGLALALSCILGLSSCVNNPILIFDFNYLPVFYVLENPVNPDRAKLLADALGIDESIIASDGSIRYLNRERFQALTMRPLGIGESDEDNNRTIREGFDFEAIKNIKILSDADALSRAEAALEAAGLKVQGGTANIGHSRFEAVDKAGAVITDTFLDTQIDFEAVTPNGYTLKGPGADVKIVFDGDGVVTQLNYAFRVLAEGQRAALLSTSQAKLRAAAKYFDVNEDMISLQNNCASSRVQLGTLCLQSEMVYYAPPLDMAVQQIAPHYLFKGSFNLEGKSFEVRNLLIPALEDAPQVSLTMSVSSGNTIKATSQVSGGKAPYSYAWSSSTTPLTVGNASSLSYGVSGRENVTEETLTVLVTDANGISSWASQTLAISPPALVATQQIAKTSVGAEWIGLSQGLPYAASNTEGFLKQVKQAGVDIAFNWGETSAFQRDFARETDASGVDSTDFVFYTGHAYGLGFFFETLQDRRSFTSDQASWGENDLEWLAIAACGPLQEKEAGISWWLQWGRAFNGLHLMLAYANTTYDNNREGQVFGEAIFSRGLSLRQAWASAATEVQTPAEIYAIMGVFGNDNVNNYNDHFWNLGPVGPDIPATSVKGYWRLSGPS
ncbi:MAG: SprB repeat-containing protein [Trueperaceae bacterium]|nr:SprB repeat-containing protein [Trueperaceae bacterium]